MAADLQQLRKKLIAVALGHVFSIDFPKQYNNWDACEPVDLFEAPTIKMESNPKTHITKHLANEAKDVDYLVLWLDCDREGENICFEVMSCTQVKMNNPSTAKKRILRAKFSGSLFLAVALFSY